MTITAKYASVCSVCRQSIAPGAKIEWAKGAPVKHASCAGAAATPSAGPALSSGPGVGAHAARRAGRWTGCQCGSREDSHGDLIPSARNCATCEHDA
jgi:hypothetical protein